MENIKMSYNTQSSSDNSNNTNTFEVTETKPPEETQQPPQEPQLEFKVDESMESFKEQVREYVKANNPLLSILTPCYNGGCDINYVLSLLKTIELFNSLNFPINVLFCRNDSLITRARNNLIAKAMSNPKTTHMLFIDSDITWSQFDVLKLVLANKPIVGGAYPLKKYNWGALLVDKENPYNSNVVQSMLNKREASIMKNAISKEDFIQASLLEYNINYLESTLSVNNNLTKVRHVATGFMMLQRNTLVQMMNYYSHTKYTDDTGYLEGENDNRFAYALFNCDVGYGHYLSEDWLFCDRWMKMDGEVFIDISISLNHTGINDFKGCFLSSLL
jgi:hypothetical protein